MSVPPPCVTKVKDYVPYAPLPPVVHTQSAPPMPADGCRSHCHPLGGYVHPGGLHKLSRMYRYDQVDFDRHVQEFTNSISEMELVYNTGLPDDLTLYVDGIIEEIPRGTPPHLRANIVRQRNLKVDEDVNRRAEDTILTTASSIYHKLFPSTPSHWAFRRHRVYGVLPQYFNAYIFGEWEDMASLSTGSVAVFVVPPWYLAPRDMEDVINTHRFKYMPITGETSPSVDQKRQHYWAMIDNVCYNNKIRHFALTTYEQWVFGCLSDDWKVASLSEVRGQTASNPTILEYLLFWMHCGGGSEPGMRPSEDLFWGDPQAIHAISSLY
ncbi:hypothetical protein PLICRDRAFT_321432 [Plicaturopsis crispa FD-325 SS-3]|nr:hypothetical protein PLICRDRAFT_321432 [Plicaturopsis crispa FD-325 SS-3]